MRVVLTGAGTGGHFYPLIAVAESLIDECSKAGIVSCDIRFFSPEKMDEAELDRLKIKFSYIPAGKVRIYPSIKNILDIFKTFAGIVVAFFKLLFLYPDVIFSKGGYGSFPVTFCAWILRIPVIVHESDTVPGRTNLWSGKHAVKVAVSYEVAGKYFDASKVAHTGQPVRRSILSELQKPQAKNERPLILVVGGSLGSKIINDSIIPVLPEILNFADVIHQTGTYEAEARKQLTGFYIDKHEHKDKYHTYDFISGADMSRLLAQCTIVISRAGSFLFEIAASGKPSIVVPISESNGDHQRQNAYNYTRNGSGLVVEEQNLTPVLLSTLIKQVIDDQTKYQQMSKKAREFFLPGASELIAKELINISKKHG